MSSLKLSILICTLVGREDKLNNLLGELCRQSISNRPIEIKTLRDQGELTVGEKRNRLVNDAEGEYCCFIDDDDSISDYYIEEILNALQNSPDCASMHGLIDWKKERREFKHSIQYRSWYTGYNKVFYRTPNHLNPIRTDIVRYVKFKNLTCGEDHDFSKRILPLLKTEGKVKNPIYFYSPSNDVLL